MIIKTGGKNAVNAEGQVNKLNLTMNGTSLTQCGTSYPDKNIKFLGLQLDNNLSWNIHIDKTANKLRGIIQMLAQAKNILPLKARIMTFKSLFMSIAEYGIGIYGNSNHFGQLTKLQKWCVRNVYKQPISSHSKPLLKRCNTLKLTDIYKSKVLSYLRSHAESNTPNIIRNMFIFHQEKNRKANVFEKRRPINTLINCLVIATQLSGKRCNP